MNTTIVYLDETAAPVGMVQFAHDTDAPQELPLNAVRFNGDLPAPFPILAKRWRLKGGVLQDVGEPATMWHRWDLQSEKWFVDIAAARLDCWGRIKRCRGEAEQVGVVWDGSVFDSDTLSQSRITGAVSLAQLTPDFSIVWVLKDNSTRILNQQEMLQVGVAFGQHVAAQFAKAALLRNRIEAANTIEELNAIEW